MARYYTPFPWYRFHGTEDNDDFHLWSGRYLIYGLNGNDRFFISEGFSGWVIGGIGNDLVSFGDTSFGVTLDNTNGYVLSSTSVYASADRYHGTSFNDVFRGGDVDTYVENHQGYGSNRWGFNNDFYGGAGNDTFYNGNGKGRFVGGRGDDVAYGGNDTLWFYGGVGNDRAYGGNGDEWFYGHEDNDVLKGSGGADRVYGGVGNDHLFGGNDDDTLRGGDGNDVADGGSGNDNVAGGWGSDRVHGGDDNDIVQGWGGWSGGAGSPNYYRDGNDYVYGGAGDDYVYGAAGRDLIQGGRGKDNLYGDAGRSTASLVDHADTFVFNGSYHRPDLSDTGTVQNNTADTIWDFDRFDTIRIPYGLTYGGTSDAPDPGEYTVSAYGIGWLLRWNTEGYHHDVVVAGDDPTGQVIADVVPLI